MEADMVKGQNVSSDKGFKEGRSWEEISERVDENVK